MPGERGRVVTLRAIPETPEGPVYQCLADGDAASLVKIIMAFLNHLKNMGNKEVAIKTLQ